MKISSLLSAQENKLILSSQIFLKDSAKNNLPACFSFCVFRTCLQNLSRQNLSLQNLSLQNVFRTLTFRTSFRTSSESEPSERLLNLQNVLQHVFITSETFQY
ncbi:hypothetical protein QL285_039071 [Trifolium repens]|nr:hypothetical protein QL285_039071 [Trifolium repens]